MGEEILSKLSARERRVCTELLDRSVDEVALATNQKANTLRVSRRRTEKKLSVMLGRDFVFPRLHTIGRRIKPTFAVALNN